CLVGFTQIGPGPKTDALSRWLRNPSAPLQNPANPPPTVKEFAGRVSDFVFKHLPECDGISFDIEGLKTGQPLELPTDPPAVRQQRQQNRLAVCKTMEGNIEAFYRTLADTLKAKSTFIGIATAGLTSKTEINRGVVPQDMALIQQFSIARNRENILIRPMAFD